MGGWARARTATGIACVLLFSLTFTGAALAAPSHDDFVDALGIDSNPYTHTTDTTGASTEPDEPQPSCATVGATVWYRLDLSQSALIQVKTFGSKFDTVMALYTGTGITGLTEVACNDDDTSVGSQQSRLSASITNPATVYIQIGGFAGASGPLKLTVEYEAGLVNDNFADAIPLTEADLPYEHVVSSTANATMESGEPEGFCSFGNLGGTVWYSFASGSHRLVQASTLDSDYDTVIAVYTGGSLTTLVHETCNDQYGGNQSLLQFSAQAGTTYYIQVGGWAGSSGFLKFHLEAIVPPSNDDFVDALVVSPVELPFFDSTDTTAATIQPGEPRPKTGDCAVADGLGFGVEHTVWYKFETETATLVMAKATTPVEDDVYWNSLAVFESPSGGAGGFTDLTELGCATRTINLDFVGDINPARVVFTALPGKTYYLQAGGIANASSGSLIFTLEKIP